MLLSPLATCFFDLFCRAWSQDRGACPFVVGQLVAIKSRSIGGEFPGTVIFIDAGPATVTIQYTDSLVEYGVSWSRLCPHDPAVVPLD